MIGFSLVFNCSFFPRFRTKFFQTFVSGMCITIILIDLKMSISKLIKIKAINFILFETMFQNLLLC